MPPRKGHIPKLCRHRASGLGYVTDPADGREVWLGRHGSAECTQRYHAWVQGFLARAVPEAKPGTGGTVGRLVKAFLAHAGREYRKGGKETSEVGVVRSALRPLADDYELLPADAFGPPELAAVMAAWAAAGLARSTVNGYRKRVVGCWRWGVEQGLVSAEALGRLRAVRGIKRGRTAAREPARVAPVPAALVAATLPHCSELVRALIALQEAAGMRPGEVVLVRPVDIDRSAEPWLYTPHAHKTEGRGRERPIYLGPRARAVLAPWLARCAKPEDWCFPGHRKGTHFASQSYAGHIAEACERAGLEHWAPNRLRHNAGTTIRAAHGIEGAQSILGHASLNTSEIYAMADAEKAKKIAEELG